MSSSGQSSFGAMQLYKILQRANLLNYFESFISQGGDDVEQLCEADEEEFLEIMSLVGMVSKPLHVRRFQKALQEWAMDTNKTNGFVSRDTDVKRNELHLRQNGRSMPHGLNGKSTSHNEQSPALNIRKTNPCSVEGSRNVKEKDNLFSKSPRSSPSVSKMNSRSSPFTMLFRPLKPAPQDLPKDISLTDVIKRKMLDAALQNTQVFQNYSDDNTKTSVLKRSNDGVSDAALPLIKKVKSLT